MHTPISQGAPAPVTTAHAVTVSAESELAPQPQAADAFHRAVRALRPDILVGGWSTTLFRMVVVAAQAASVIISWPLWQVREFPPMLPLFPVPQADIGVAVLVSLAVCLVYPRAGVALHWFLLIYGCVADQIRLQPEFISLGLLLLGTLPSYPLRFIAISHLISLWLYAGLNKLVSQEFMTGGAGWMLGGFGANEWLRMLIYRPFTQIELLKGTFGYVIIASEALLAVLALHPRTRGWCAAAALLVHTGILVVLSPLGNNANEVVWPWNVALAVSGLLLILPWKDTLRASFQRLHWSAALFAGAIWLYPLGYYAGVSDAYLSHNLYTGNTMSESWCPPRGACLPGSQAGATWRTFNVPMPPERRLYEAYFQTLCTPGERLIITDRRPWAEWRGDRRREVACLRS